MRTGGTLNGCKLLVVRTLASVIHAGEERTKARGFTLSCEDRPSDSTRHVPRADRTGEMDSLSEASIDVSGNRHASTVPLSGSSRLRSEYSDFILSFCGL